METKNHVKCMFGSGYQIYVFRKLGHGARKRHLHYFIVFY